MQDSLTDPDAIKITLTLKQSKAFNRLTNHEDLDVLYGGAKGGGKSLLLSLWVKIWVEKLIKLFDLKPTTAPIPLGFIGRKQGIDFSKTTLETFKRVVPQEDYRLREHDQEIIFHETAKVFYGGLDDRQRINKFNSAEFAFFGLDQAEETERTDVDVLQAALRLKVNGIQPPYKSLYTANPADCWLKEDFIDNKLPGKLFIPALYTDNPHLPNNYGDRLESTFRYNQALLRAYKHGDWFALQARNKMITSVMLQRLKQVKHHYKDVHGIVSCDPAIGGDECVLQVMVNGKVIDQLILHERDTMKIAGHMIVLAEKHRIPHYIVDAIGLGKGIADRIRELKHRDPKTVVIELISSQNAIEEERFRNVRTEMWWYAMSQIIERNIPFPEDEELRTQLQAPYFKVIDSNGKIMLEPKKDTRKHLGRSPDRADTFVMALYGLSQTPPLRGEDAWRNEPGTEEVGAGAHSAMTG